MRFIEVKIKAHTLRHLAARLPIYYNAVHGPRVAQVTIAWLLAHVVSVDGVSQEESLAVSGRAHSDRP
jgi:hypothetical protein